MVLQFVTLYPVIVDQTSEGGKDQLCCVALKHEDLPRLWSILELSPFEPFC